MRCMGLNIFDTQEKKQTDGKCQHFFMCVDCDKKICSNVITKLCKWSAPWLFNVQTKMRTQQ